MFVKICQNQGELCKNFEVVFYCRQWLHYFKKGKKMISLYFRSLLFKLVYFHYQMVSFPKIFQYFKVILSSFLLEIFFKRRIDIIIYYVYSNLEINWWKNTVGIGISFLSLYCVQSNVPACPQSCFHLGISFSINLCSLCGPNCHFRD